MAGAGAAAPGGENIVQKETKTRSSVRTLFMPDDVAGMLRAERERQERLHREGKIRAIGISNFDPDRMIDLIEFNEITPAVNQIETHLLCQRQEEHQWMEKYHVQHMAYAPLGQGRKNEMFEALSLMEIAQVHSKTPAQIALRYLVQNNIVVISSATSKEQMQRNFSILDFQLTAEDMTRIAALDQDGQTAYVHYDPALVERLTSMVI